MLPDQSITWSLYLMLTDTVQSCCIRCNTNTSVSTRDHVAAWGTEASVGKLYQDGPAGSFVCIHQIWNGLSLTKWRAAVLTEKVCFLRFVDNVRNSLATISGSRGLRIQLKKKVLVNVIEGPLLFGLIFFGMIQWWILRFLRGLYLRD